MALYPDSNRRIVLLGKTGSGKSSTGNTILGRDEFTASSSSVSVTKHCEIQEAEVKDRVITVVDTPGLFDTSLTEEELKSEIEKCVIMSAPGPHVFLLVIRLDVRFTEEEINAVKWIQENFGEKAMQYTMILFTHEGQTHLPIAQYIEENEHLKQLVNECKAGYHCLNNNDNMNQAQVSELLVKIDRRVEQNRGGYYTNGMYEEAQRKFTEEMKRVKQMFEKFVKLTEENTKQMQENMKQMQENTKQMQENMKQMQENMKQMQKNMRRMEKNMKQIEANMQELEENMKTKETVLFSLAGLFSGVVLMDSYFQAFCPCQGLLITASIVGGVVVLWIIKRGYVRKVVTSCLEMSSLLASTVKSALLQKYMTYVMPA